MIAYRYIVVEGNIGAGKTTLATRFAGELNAALVLEQFEENSFLPRFYNDPSRYAFPLELSFLADRYQQLRDHFAAPGLFHPVTVSDYFIYKSLIFANRNLDPAEYNLYHRFFQMVSAVIPKPELILYLHTGTERLRSNILKRGRSYEQKISLEYLRGIQQGYFDFFRQQPELRILIVETDTLDFVENRKDYGWLRSLLGGEYPSGITILQRP